MRTMIKKIIKEEEGQSLVELCAIIPLVLLMIFTTITVGMLIYSHMLVSFAATQAADRAAEIMDDEQRTYADKVQEIEEVAQGYLSNGITGNQRDVQLARIDDKITVTVNYKFNLFFLFTDEVFGDRTQIPVIASATDFVE